MKKQWKLLLTIVLFNTTSSKLNGETRTQAMEMMTSIPTSNNTMMYKRMSFSADVF